GESDAALAQIDYVLQVEPTNPAAVVTRSYILLEEKQPAQAVEVVRTALERTVKDGKGDPPAVFYLMLAVAESAASPAGVAAPPGGDALPRTLKILDDGLKVHPKAQELVQARYLALVDSGRDAEALAFVEAKAKDDPRGPLRRVLVEKLREQKQYDRAAQL